MPYQTGRSTLADPSTVSTRDDFGDFVQRALLDYEDMGGVEWENGTLPRFLDALSAFSLARVAEGQDQELPTGRLFATMLAAATGYE